MSTFVDSDTNAQYLEHARIVPGSEQIVGPDMTPGYEHSGKLVRYQRVPLALGDPGLNQYKLDYDNGGIYFSSVWDQDLPDTDEFGEPLGVPIQAYYKVQFNQNGDVVRGDYSTKSLVNIHLQMRMYDPESGKPHPVDLNDSIKVRNALR